MNALHNTPKRRKARLAIFSMWAENLCETRWLFWIRCDWLSAATAIRLFGVVVSRVQVSEVLTAHYIPHKWLWNTNTFKQSICIVFNLSFSFLFIQNSPKSDLQPKCMNFEWPRGVAKLGEVFVALFIASVHTRLGTDKDREGQQWNLKGK